MEILLIEFAVLAEIPLGEVSGMGGDHSGTRVQGSTPGRQAHQQEFFFFLHRKVEEALEVAELLVN